MTSGDIRLVNETGQVTKGGCWGAEVHPSTHSTPAPEHLSYFFVAVMADGEVSLMVLPSTVPAYFVVPAVNSMAAPRSRP